MKKLFYINIVASLIVAAYFYIVLDKDQRASILSKNPLLSSINSKAQKKAFDIKEEKKEKALSNAFNKLNKTLGQSKLNFISFDLERGSQVKNGAVLATNTLEFQLGKRPTFTAEIENETKKIMKEWIRFYKHDPNEISIFKVMFKGKVIYKLKSNSTIL